MSGLETFERLESGVRSYSRAFPALFARAQGSLLFAADGRPYIDFFAGAGALNYGHNDPRLKRELLDYVARDGIAHSLDMATEAKAEFLVRFEEVILGPRRLPYRVQFTGPTGTNAVEAALKLARKATRRPTVACFTDAFHGVSLGALALTATSHHRGAAGVPLTHAVRLPFDGYRGRTDSLEQLAALLEDAAGGTDLPAAIFLETVQGEGGVHAASLPWLSAVAELARSHGVLLVVDDIQAGCGRTGPFFSFEPAGIVPDLVCLSKSISGYGLPMSLLLIRPELDLWQPGEHNGTFRGNNLAFVTAAAALSYWRDGELEKAVGERARQLERRLAELCARHPQARGEIRGRGLFQGLALKVPGLAPRVAREAFARGLVIETCGRGDEVLKFLPPLLIEAALLDDGLDRLEAALAACTAGAERPLAAAEAGGPRVAGRG